MREANLKEEWLDLVDEKDNVIGSMSRSEAYQKKMFSSLRSTWLMIKNSQNQLWIPRRRFDKKMLPGALDGSVVGHVSAGETYEQALIREAVEEVGIDLTQLDYRFVGKLNPHVDNGFCFAAVYEVCLEDVPNWNGDDFVEFYWLTPQEIIDRLTAGDSAKDQLSIILKKFYLKSDRS